ncbi:hypothetical protein EDB83DRAFT_2212852 [Lactarius deliciosus]|nr:hypothetical protein EDB83DRAFT_2212852 [Lactarius deliciosus]
MSSRVDSAVPTRLSSIRNELIGKKLRVVGKILSHDVRSSSVFLWNDKHIVSADISLCLPTSGSVPWLRESRCTVTLFGYLERPQVMYFFPPMHVLMVDSHRYATCQADMRLPDLPEQLPHKEIELIPHFSLQAILVLDSPDVDLRLWNDTVAEMEASGTSVRFANSHMDPGLS